MILPDTEAVHIQHLLDLLTSGKVRGFARAWAIFTLAKCFKIEIRKTDFDLTPTPQDMDKRPPPIIRVKKLQDMMSSPPLSSEPLKEMQAKKPNSRNFPNVEKGVEEDRKSCVFCHKIFRISRLKIHLEEECRVRGSVNFTVLPYKCKSCGILYLDKERLFAHMRRKHYPNVPLYHCSFCDSRFSKQLQLKQHISKAHKRASFQRHFKFVYRFSKREGPPSCFYDLI